MIKTNKGSMDRINILLMSAKGSIGGQVETPMQQNQQTQRYVNGDLLVIQPCVCSLCLGRYTSRLAPCQHDEQSPYTDAP